MSLALSSSRSVSTRQYSGTSAGKSGPVRGGAPSKWGGLFPVDWKGLTAFLRATHPSKTAASVSAATGLPAETVKKWLAGEAAPSGSAMLSLICAYGPDLIHAAVPRAPIWLSAAARAQRRDLIAAQLADLQNQMNALRDQEG